MSGSGPVLSVRGDAQVTVMPDLLRLPSVLSAGPASKEQALRDVAAAQERLLADLAARGGVPRRADTERAALTWSSYSATTEDEHELDSATGQYAVTGRVTALVLVLLTVRELDTLDELTALLAGHDRLRVDEVQWGVDPDNPAWPVVRADAIRAAIRKGRDYAAALGGSLQSVEHLADAGLLGGTDQPYGGAWVHQSGMARSGSRGVPSLDPVPQTLTATIEARFVAVGVSLDDL